MDDEKNSTDSVKDPEEELIEAVTEEVLEKLALLWQVWTESQ